MRSLWQDVKYGLRMLLKNPGFTLAAALSLALGIGANSTIYSIVHAVLLDPLPVEQPERVLSLTPRTVSHPTYMDARASAKLFSNVAAYAGLNFSLNAAGRTELVWGNVVSGNYFETLGVRPVAGRAFLPEEDVTPATHPVAVISYDLWQRSYGGAGDAVGKTVTLNNRPLTIIGVAPRGFRGVNLAQAPEVWVPIQMWSQVATGEGARLTLDRRGWSWLNLFGRLQEGASAEQAQAELNAIIAQLKEAHPRLERSLRLEATPLVTAASGLRTRQSMVRFITILAAVVGIALLIACANVANLLLARATGRRKEIAVRLALGASRGRIVRQLLTESLLLAGLGGALGLLIAMWAMDALAAYELPGRIEIAQLGLGLRREVLLFTLLVSFITGVVFGLAPALQASKPDLVSALKEQGAGSVRGRLGLRGAFLAAQVALCLVLLVGAGLFIKSLRTALAADPGFETERVALVSVNLGLQRYTPEQAERFYSQSVERIKNLPGVEAASWASVSPLYPFGLYMLTVAYDGYQPAPGEELEAEFNFVGHEYFQTMGVPILRGRGLAETDRDGSPPVAVINETLAQRYFPNADPLGRTINLGGEQRLTIVGVARDAKYHSLSEEARPYIYAPLQQNIQNVGLEALTLHVRTAGDPARTLDRLRAEIGALDSNLPFASVRTINEQIGSALMAQRFGSSILGFFSFLTLALAAVGIYGVVAYFVGQRTREIGIRLALGAHRRDILRLMLVKSLLPIGVGICIGLGAALALTRALSSFLYGVSATDPATFIVATLLLAATALLASYIPARRATKVDPLVALRYE